MKVVVLFFIIISSQIVNAVPIDWHGAFGVDTTSIYNYRKIKVKSTNAVTGGSQEVDLGSGGKSTASYESYLFHLNPQMIINDSVTFKGEITTGYGRGGRLGDSSAPSRDIGFGNALYMQNTSYNNAMNMNQAYLELYSDTATWLIGRHSNHWGMGAVINSGENSWDRYASIRDGVTVKLKLGNFGLTPYWGKISAGDSSTTATQIKEFGTGLTYDNPERDMSFGLLYGKKVGAKFNTSYKEDIDGNGTSQSIGQTDIKITDIYFRKIFKKLTFTTEIPLMSGEIGQIYNKAPYNNSENIKYGAKAFLFNFDYKLSENWKTSLLAGSVSGDGSSIGSFNAMYLNPNFQIANLMFRYNMMAVSDTSKSLYDSYVTNVRFLKLTAVYQGESWTFITGLIYAKADQVATGSDYAYNHTKNVKFLSTQVQSDDLGYELDLNANYHWNTDTTVGFAGGYHFVGDYYGYTNTTSSNHAENSYVLQLSTIVKF